MPEEFDSSRPLANFESNLEELERIVKQLESGDLPLERAFELFERGVELFETCRRQIEEAETKVEILLKKKSGEVQPEPFAPEKE